jgi:hypothetical protein
MFCPAMKLFRTPTMRLALLLALIMPLRPANPSALLSLRCSPPAIILDRLDRPPRTV